MSTNSRASTTTAPPFSYANVIRSYIDTLLKSKPPGLKALLVDEEVRNTISVNYTQHQLLQHEVVLVDLLSKVGRPQMHHLTCIVLCRPTAASLADVSQALSHPTFGSYHLVFTNCLEIAQLEMLVNAENGASLVKSVEEVYLDTTPVTDDASVIPLFPQLLSADTEPKPSANPLIFTQWDSMAFQRVTQGITAMMLGMRRRAVIRYRNGSKACERIAHDLSQKVPMLNSQFPDLRSKDAMVLILDRKDDPITPLLTQWTYEAMVHELLGFTNGNCITVSESAAGSEKLEDRNHILSPLHDGFYANNRYSDFGQLCLSVRDLVESYKSLNNIDRSTASLEEIKSFVARMPDAKQESMVMTRHASIVGMLSDEVRTRGLANSSVVEQDIITESAVNDHSKAVMEVVKDPATGIDDALRLVMIYALRYEKNTSNIIPQLIEALEDRGCSPSRTAKVQQLLNYAGSEERVGDIFNITHGIAKAMRKLVTGFSDEVTNVLTQHTPWLKKIVNRAYNDVLSPEEYPFAGPVQEGPEECSHIIVFVVGGITYEEARLCNEINAGNVANKPPSKERTTQIRSMMKGMMHVGGGNKDREAGEERPPEKIPSPFINTKIVLASTSMLNSNLFIDSLPRGMSS